MNKQYRILSEAVKEKNAPIGLRGAIKTVGGAILGAVPPLGAIAGGTMAYRSAQANANIRAARREEQEKRKHELRLAELNKKNIKK